MKFKNLLSGEIKDAYSAIEDGQWFNVQFFENGKIYRYNSKNIEIIPSEPRGNFALKLYSLKRKCWKCNKDTEAITYIKFMDNPAEDVVYPWDKNRLLKTQNTMAHMFDESIEYYGLNVVGDIAAYDQLLMEEYPDRIKKLYSKTEDKVYPMNVCCCCGAKQGRFFVYAQVNKLIDEMEQIPSIDFG